MATLNLAKSYDFFKPEEVKERIHIIGCGSVGSTVAELLARFGLTKLALYDFDKVEPKNLANQMFRQEHVGKEKSGTLAHMLCEINPEMKDSISVASHGYVAQKLSGYVFLCVDNIDLRREIAEAHKDSIYVKAMFDFRTRLTDAQHYAADWSSMKMRDDFLRSMNFTHEEATAETPVSACNTTLSVAPTIRMISSLGVANFINFAKGQEIKKFIQIDAFSFILDAF
ncbi:MAG: ThiF family adenylyltransferase [Defluviitaleaceae bacterium]|nr:ThiF family adenylyltransferase [Defluviitaleaceae bacterium]MCL2273658.1 ThiF family adenylyltransferase [Defluviitaleaceae bacterium]